MKPRLHQILPRTFLLPLMLGILCSTLFTIIYLIFYAKNLSLSSDIKTYIDQANTRMSEPIIYTVQNMVYRKIQGTIDTLVGLKNFYNSLEEMGNVDLADKAGMIEFINRYAFNGVDLYNNFEEKMKIFLDQTSTNSNSNTTNSNYSQSVNFLDYAVWFINPSNTSLNDLDLLAIKQIYTMTHMVMLLRSEYEVYKANPEKGYRNIYAGFSQTELFYKYPLDEDQSLLYPMVSMSNDPSCRDKDMSVPNFFFIKCRPWYAGAKTFRENYNLQISITAPYKIQIITQKLGFTICITSDDKYSTSSTQDNFLVICIDLNLTEMLYSFDTYNNLLSGYYFITRIESGYPIYYPNIIEEFSTGDVYAYEFGKNTSFYLDELSAYATPLKIFASSLNNTADAFAYNGTYYIDGVQQSFQIYPIMFNANDDPTVINHLMSIIYVTNGETMTSMISQYQSSIIPTLLFQCFIFILLGAIVFLISRYLLASIAIGIVRPIKLMKKLIEGMNNKKISLLAGNRFALTEEGEGENVTEEEEENEELVKNKELLRDRYRDDLVDFDDQQVNFGNADDMDEEENFGLRSKDIDNLFEKLINLKKVVTYSQDTSLNTENESIMNYLFAEYTFKEDKNFKSKYLCDSNVGNLTLKCRKYDKAILHLLESLKDPLNDNSTLRARQNLLMRLSGTLFKPGNSMMKHSGMHNSYNLSGGKKSIFLNRGSRSSYSISTSLNLTSILEKNQQKIEVFKKKFLDSRYPKLIYAFKKYYKNLSRLIKPKDSLWDEVTVQDFYAVAQKHSLEQYERILIEYCHISLYYGEDKKVVEAILEYNEFLIKYKLKTFDNSLQDMIYSLNTYSPSSNNSPNSNVSNPNTPTEHEVKSIKAEVIKQITRNFKEVDSRMRKLKTQVTHEYIKKILDMVNVLKKDSVEMIETPIHVFNQKANYLKGKFFYNCNNHSQALTFFNESKREGIICNASIIKSSIKKIKKILKIFRIRVKLGVGVYHQFEDTTGIAKNIPTKTRQEMMLTSLEEKKAKLKKYKVVLTDSLKRYTYYPKDIAVLVNFSASMKSDPKKMTMSLKCAMNVFENLTTAEDRFSLFSYSHGADPLINLTYKNINTVDFIKHQIDNYLNKDIYEDMGSRGDNKISSGGEAEFAGDGNNNHYRKSFSQGQSGINMFPNVSMVYDYLLKKNYHSNKIREKWIIVITDEIGNGDIEYLRVNDIWDVLFEKCLYTHLIIFTLNKEKENIPNNTFTRLSVENLNLNINPKTYLKNTPNPATTTQNLSKIELLKQRLRFNKSGILDIDRFDIMKKKMRISGFMNEVDNFTQEKYEKSLKI